jgi:hypothetical protein
MRRAAFAIRRLILVTFLVQYGCSHSAVHRPAEMDRRTSVEAPSDLRCAPITCVFVDRPCQGRVGIAPFHQISVKQHHVEAGEFADTFKMQIATSTGTPVELEFESSYGRFQLHIIPALPGGEAVLCLRTGRGRGTEVRSESLAVYRLHNERLERVLDLAIGGWEFDPDRDDASVYREMCWVLADVDGDGVGEVLVSPSDPYTWTTTECAIYRWSPVHLKFLRS